MTFPASNIFFFPFLHIENSIVLSFAQGLIWYLDLYFQSFVAQCIWHWWMDENILSVSARSRKEYLSLKHCHVLVTNSQKPYFSILFLKVKEYLNEDVIDRSHSYTFVKIWEYFCFSCKLKISSTWSVLYWFYIMWIVALFLETLSIVNRVLLLNKYS